MSARTRRPRCGKHVFSGARHDMAGHRCGNYALDGSDFCHVHQAETTTIPPQDAEASAEPRVTSSTRRSYFAALEWEPGEGPLVKPPYYRGLGFITRAMAKATDNGEALVDVRGLLRKKDGTPGLQSWDATFRAEDVIPAQYLSQLLAALEEERRG